MKVVFNYMQMRIYHSSWIKYFYKFKSFIITTIGTVTTIARDVTNGKYPGQSAAGDERVGVGYRAYKRW